MPLQELDHWINQISEQYGEGKNQEYSAGAIDSRAHAGNQKSSQHDIRGVAIRKGHFWRTMSTKTLAGPIK